MILHSLGSLKQSVSYFGFLFEEHMPSAATRDSRQFTETTPVSNVTRRARIIGQSNKHEWPVRALQYRKLYK